MAPLNSAEGSESKSSYQLGFYSLTPGLSLQIIARQQQPGQDRDVPTQLSSSWTLSALSGRAPDGVDCVIADIRNGARQVLVECHPIAEGCPVIALVDPDQALDDGYPFGTHISDVTTPDELGKAVFWHRVKCAIQTYDKPLTVAGTNSPVYRIFQEIANHTSDWIFIKDLQHQFVVVGEHFAAIAGTSVQEIVGKNDLEIGSSTDAVKGSPDEGKVGFWAQDDAVTNSGEGSVEENPEWSLYSTKARYRRTYRVPLKNPAGNVFALLVCSQDITEQVRNEELLVERTSMLEQVTAEKQRAESNRQIAEESVKAKTRFMAAASHDLRQPLHAMGLILDSLDKRLRGRDEHHLVQQIKQSCSSLNTLFNGCLDISRLDAGVVDPHLEHICAATFLNGLDEEFRREAREKSLEYRLTVDDSVLYTDQMLLARILRNLLANAVQNTENGYLSIECKSAGSRITLSVIDTGSGIAADELVQVFHEFHQIDKNDARKGRGLGLGLSIVKRLCDLLEISITLDSQLGQGTRFTLRIPAGEQASIPFVQKEQQVNLPDGLVVLIVDDDQFIRYGMEVLLESFGCQPMCASDAQSAINALQGVNLIPDIIVADYHLSLDVTGTEAIVELRKQFGASVPAILVTGDTSMQGEREAAIHDFPILHKPVNSDELLAVIHREIENFRSKELH